MTSDEIREQHRRAELRERNHHTHGAHTMNELGQQVRAARKGRKLTAVQLAEKLDVNKVSLLRWERGEVPLSFARLQEIAEHLGYKVRVELVEGE